MSSYKILEYVIKTYRETKEAIMDFNKQWLQFEFVLLSVTMTNKLSLTNEELEFLSTILVNSFYSKKL